MFLKNNGCWWQDVIGHRGVAKRVDYRDRESMTLKYFKNTLGAADFTRRIFVGVFFFFLIHCLEDTFVVRPSLEVSKIFQYAESHGYLDFCK